MKKDLTKLREVINNDIDDDKVHRIFCEVVRILEMVDIRCERNEAWLQSQSAAKDRTTLAVSGGSKKQRG